MLVMGVRRGRSRKDRGWMGSEKLVGGSLGVEMEPIAKVVTVKRCSC